MALAVRGPVCRERSFENFRRDGAEAGPYLLFTQSGLGPADHGKPPVAPLVERRIFVNEDRFRAKWSVDVDATPDVDASESRLGHADDLDGVGVERDLFIEDIRIGGVFALPEFVAQDGNCRAAALIVGRGEGSADQGFHAQGREEVAADPIAAGVANFASIGEIELVRAEGEDAGENILAVAHLLPNGIAPIVPCATDHLEQLFGVGDGEGFEHYRIDQAEDGGVGADAEGQRQNRHGGEAGAGAEGSESVAEVLEEGVEHMY